MIEEPNVQIGSNAVADALQNGESALCAQKHNACTGELPHPELGESLSVTPLTLNHEDESDVLQAQKKLLIEVASIGEQLLDVEKTMKAEVCNVLEAFQSKLAYDATKQLQIDRLHEELQEYRRDLVMRTTRPLVNGVIQLHDDMSKLLAALREKPLTEITPQKFLSLLEGLQEDVEIVLSQNGITSYREPMKHFDPRRQKVLRTVQTSDESLAGTVAESMRPGFEQGIEILAKERVALHEFVSQLTVGSELP